jgi:hypothetical protein
VLSAVLGRCESKVNGGLLELTNCFHSPIEIFPSKYRPAFDALKAPLFFDAAETVRKLELAHSTRQYVAIRYQMLISLY